MECGGLPPLFVAGARSGDSVAVIKVVRPARHTSQSQAFLSVSNRQRELIEIVITSTKQTVGAISNRQLFGGGCQP
jgi:hypothetical protein